MVRRRSGSLLFGLMLGVLLILGILALSLNMSLGEKTNFMNAHSTSLLLDMAAMEVGNQTFAAIAAELRNPRGGLFQKLLKARNEDFPLAVPPVWATSFDFQDRSDLPHISCAISADLADPSSLESGSWKDPWEKFFSVRVRLELTVGSQVFQKNSKSYVFSRHGKIHALSLPVLGKCTLFLREPEPTDENHAGYNCFRNTIDGKPLSPHDTKRGVESPIILRNSTENKMTDLRKAGFIFLGGDKDLQLHLTNGGNSRFGETFHFYPIEKPEGKPPLFDLGNLPGSLRTPISLAGGTAQGVPGIQQTLFGFYDQDNCSPPNSMNLDGTLGYFFDRSPPRTMDSSSLHLLGTYDPCKPFQNRTLCH